MNRDPMTRARPAGIVRLTQVAAAIATIAVALSRGPLILAQPATAPETTSRPALPASPRNASYSIDAALDPGRHQITGREVITWQNISAVAVSDLRLHLYWNAWRNSRSTWLRERSLSPADEDDDERREGDWSWIDISAARLIGDAPPIDLLSGLRFVAPDDGNEDDRTLASLRFPAPVGPGETINIELEWTARVPHAEARTGYVGSYYFLAQWFPKVAVLGSSGWRAHQFHTSTEFFADYGRYDVRLRVPRGWIVGATGRQHSTTDNDDGTTTHRYQQDDVHDFAWTTSPDFIERRQRFEEPGLPAVDMRLLLQPEHLGQADRHFAATAAALRHYGRWYGPYPYGHITIVDPAWAESIRRHGVSDVVHRRDGLVAAAGIDRSRGSDRARGGTSVLVRARRQQ